MWPAHAFTLSRIPIAIAIVATYGHPVWTLALLALAAATDVVDGNLARYLQRHGCTKPDIGGWLDPLVDKIFVVIVLATIFAHTHDTLLVGLVATREILLVPIASTFVLLNLPTAHLRAGIFGKLTTIAQIVTCAIAVFDPYRALPYAVLSAVLGVAAVVHYLVREARVTTPA
jgi:cardiolipin synthase